MKAKRIMGFFLSLVMFTAYLPLNPIASYANDGDVTINEENFPDENFRKYVRKNFDNDGNGILSKDECDNVKEISINVYPVNSLNGIEHFENLTILNCYNNKLTSLDVSKNTKLTYLNCWGNQLKELNVSGNPALATLNCSNNKLTSLDVSNNKELKELNCFENQITDLNVSGASALAKLNCRSNKLTSLDVSKNLELADLYCGYNQLTSLDVSNNKKLENLSCFFTQLTGLDVSGNPALTNLDCNNNQLTSLDVSKNTALTNLYCYNNQLKEKLDLKWNPKLTELYCNKNQLTELNVSDNPELKDLNCSQNKLEKLDVSNNTALSYLYGRKNPLTSVKLIDKEYEEKDFKPITYTVEVEKGSKKIPFSKLPPEFNKTRIKPNVKLEEDGFTWDGQANPIKFKYKLYENSNEFVDAEITVISKYWTVTFETEDETKGTVDAKNTVYVLKTETKTLADITAPEVTAKEGYEFDKWEPTLDKNTAIDKDLTVKAHFKQKEVPVPTPIDPKVIGPVDPQDPNGGKPADVSKYYTVTFETEDETKGTVNAKNTVYVLKTETKTLADITAPEVTAKEGYEFDKWEPTLDKNTAIDKDLKVKARFKQKEAPVPTPTDKKVIGPVDPKDPNGEKPADTSKYFTVTFKSEDETKGTVDAKNTVYVLKTETKTLADITAPEVTAKEGYEFDKWEPALTNATTINKDMTVTAYFKKVKKNSDNKKPQGAKNGKFPKTANSINIAFNTAFMILSGALLVLAVKKRKKS